MYAHCFQERNSKDRQDDARATKRRSHRVHAPGAAVVPAKRVGATAGHGSRPHGGRSEAAYLDGHASPGIRGQGGNRVKLAIFVEIKKCH